MSAEEALTANPVEVKVFDRYLTVASVVSSMRTQEQEVMSSPPSDQPVPNRLCSMRVILLLEDMGPTGDPEDEVSGILQPQTVVLCERVARAFLPSPPIYCSSCGVSFSMYGAMFISC